jgi:predicted nucleic acid-binding protein
MYLPDTNVFSELKKVESGSADSRVEQWFAGTRNKDIWLSVVVSLETRKGILLKQRHDPAQAAELKRWYEEEMLRRYKPRVLPISLEIAERCAALHVPDPRPFADSLLAATALVHGLAVVTGNVRDFRGTGVRIVNPWD